MCACAAKLLLHVGLSSYTVLCWLVGVLKRLKLALAITQATIVLKSIFDMKQPQCMHPDQLAGCCIHCC